MHLTWQKGGEALVTALSGERIALSSSIPSAPGSRLDGALGSGSSIRVKVASCKRQGASFAIDDRLIDGTRELRAELMALLAGGEGKPEAKSEGDAESKGSGGLDSA